MVAKSSNVASGTNTPNVSKTSNAVDGNNNSDIPTALNVEVRPKVSAVDKQRQSDARTRFYLTGLTDPQPYCHYDHPTPEDDIVLSHVSHVKTYLEDFDAVMEHQAGG